MRCSYFRIRKPNMDSNYMAMADTVVTASIPGSTNVAFANAIVRRNSGGTETLWVFGTQRDDGSKIYGFWTSDPTLQAWKSAVVVDFVEMTLFAQWSGVKGAFNVDVTTRPDGTSVMAIEARPICCVTVFAECKGCGDDLSSGWRPTKYTASGLGETANPTIRFLDGYYYLVAARSQLITKPKP